ncbi:MAG TPA: hypothetical protein VGP93_14860 [Polyangiaceae bacterium]|jgi:hypothetical protein|nr:hypothetical protein [Polyangiaceae bacterium]
MTAPATRSARQRLRLVAPSGARDVAHRTRYYAGARQELLHETNRDEVQRDVLTWLAKTV